MMIDEFLARWSFVRGMTTEFLSTATDDCLDFRPGEKFMTIREQAVHLVEVQGLYQLAFAGEEVDFARKPEFRPHADDAATIIAAIEGQDAELVAHLDALRDNPSAFTIDWYGNSLGVAGYGAVFIQHESLHHGQWAAYAALGGHPTPTGWVMNWGLYA